MGTFEIPDDYDALNAWVNNRQKEVEETNVVGRKMGEEISAIVSEEAELAAQLSALKAKRRAIQDEQDRLRREARAKLNELNLGRSKLDTFESEKRKQEKLQEKKRLLDEIKPGAKWREFAYTHQIDGADRLAISERAILGDKRGLGKTLTSIIYMDKVQAKKVLVFAPKDVLHNFGREISHWSPERKYVVLGGMPKRERNQFLDMCATGIVDELLLLVNYEAWVRDKQLIDRLIAVGFDTVIIDEAHNIKEKTTVAFRGIKEIIHANNKCPDCGGKPEQFRQPNGSYGFRCSVCEREQTEFGEFWSVKNVVPMTGTAILNKPQDMWTLLHLVDPVAFPRESVFLYQYCEIKNNGKWGFKPGGAKRLTTALGMKYVARDDKTAGVKMPPQEITHHYIQWDEEAEQMYPKQAKVMRQIREFGAIKMAEDVALNIIGILAELTRNRQAVVWPAGIKIKDPITKEVLYEADAHESIKMDKAQEIILQAIDEEDRVVVFSQFKEALKELETRLNRDGISVARYDGDTPDHIRQQIQHDFDAKTAKDKPCSVHIHETTELHEYACDGYRWQVVLCNYKTGGVGLNLNAARQMVILDREWNPGKEDQAQGRIQRLNTKHDTIVHIIHVENTIDNFMDALIEHKASVIEDYESESNSLEMARQALISGDFKFNG